MRACTPTQFDEMKSIPRVYLTPREVARALGCDPQTIRKRARTDPESLSFKVIVIGHRVRIPKDTFLDQFLTKG